MQSEVIPAVIAATGGVAALSAIAAHERGREQAMRASRLAYSVIFPIGAKAEAAAAALSSLSGIDDRFELVCEVAADADGIRHLVHLPERVATSVIDQLSAGLPGLRVDPVEARPTGAVTTALRLVVPVRAVLRTEDPVHANRALLGGLGALRDGERVSLRWALRPARATADLPDAQTTPSMRQRAEHQALRAQIGEPGFHVAGLLLVRASSSVRARELVGHLNSMLRSRRGVGNGLMTRRAQVRGGAVMPGTGRRRGWLSAAALLPLLGWPLGEEAIHGVELGAARRMPVPRGLAKTGRILFIGRDAYGDRAVVLSPEAARHHLAVAGGTGTGKSTLLAGAILGDLEAGFGGVVIDPKADLVADLLDRVPRAHADRVVVLDPSSSEPVPGLNLLGVGDPDLRADVVLGALAAVYHASWGLRTETYLRLGLRTLSELPEPVLTDWLRLFTDGAFRNRAVGRLRDPLLRAAWASYEAMSAAEQHQHVAAPMSKVMSLLSRPAVRNVLAQRQPKLNIGRLLDERKWLLISLPPGTLGEPAARLLGAILTYSVWTAIEARTAIPKERRRPVFLYVDELQSLSDLPFGIEYLFERARGLGCGVTVATQALGRLPEQIRRSLLGNVGSLVTFRCAYEEASRLARELPGVGVQDLQALGRFEVAARIGTGVGSGVAVVTGTTRPLPAVTGQAAAIRRLSAKHYGGVAADIEDDLQEGAQADRGPSDASLGRKRRAS